MFETFFIREEENNSLINVRILKKVYIKNYRIFWFYFAISLYFSAIFMAYYYPRCSGQLL